MAIKERWSERSSSWFVNETGMYAMESAGGIVLEFAGTGEGA